MDIKEFEAKLSAIVEHAKRELGGIRANRPSPLMIEDIYVAYFEQQMPIKQLGSISVVPPRELQVTAWDSNAVPLIAKAIDAANLGVSVSAQGMTVHVMLPMLSDERRKELIKIVKVLVEEEKIKIRISRDDENKKIDAAQKSKIISEDDKFILRKKVQESVDRANTHIDGLLAAKTKEIEQ